MAALLLYVCRCTSLFLLLFAFSSCAQAQSLENFLNPRYLNCLRNASGPLPATFTRDRNAALLNFTVLASEGVPYNTTSPSSAGDVALYAMFECRGDLSLQSCSTCVQNVTAVLPLACPASVGARLGTEGCLLRYDNQSFFHLDTSPAAAFFNVANTTDVVALTAISNVMQNVMAEAPGKPRMFAEASEMGIYAAAQCWGYLTQEQCSQCLSAYSYHRFFDSRLGGQLHLGSCMYRFEAYDFLDTPTPSSPSPTPAMTPLSAGIKTPLQPRSGSKVAVIAVSVVAGFIVIAGTLCCVLVWHHKANKMKGIKQLEKFRSLPPNQLFQQRARLFTLKEVEEATANFDPCNKLGEGGFGLVYKGTLSSGQEVAIKKLYIKSQGKQDFVNEVNLLTNVQHKNLIQLLGCCVEGPERILVYEYMPNKSLDRFLFSRKSRKLNWSARFGIIHGMAKGLAYLHEESYIRIIHRDIKPGNILLDDQFNPVIADFGLARLVNEDASGITTRVAGTFGYLAPEYAVGGALSEKVDVFSFGLVCLEIVTGFKNAHGLLLARVWEKYQGGHVLDLVDERLAHVVSPEQVLRVVHISLLCTSENPKHRPAMSKVILWLSGTSDILEIPSRPTFLDYCNSKTLIDEVDHQESLTSASSSRSMEQVSRVSGGVISSIQLSLPR